MRCSKPTGPWLFALSIAATGAGCTLLFTGEVEQCAIDADCPSESVGGNVTPLVCVDRLCVADTPSVVPDGGTPPPPLLPFVVDSRYSVSGHMGDGEVGAVTVGNVCDQRAGLERGDCHRFTYTKPATTMGWAGVYWQFPGSNWGTSPGYAIPEGAIAVSFHAWSDVPVTAIFHAGIAAADGFEVKLEGVALGTSPRRFTIDIGAVTYDEVVGAFAWVTNAPAGEVHTVYIDDLVWTDAYPDVEVTFQLTHPEPLEPGCTLQLLGSFNDWDINATTLDGPVDDVYAASVQLPARAEVEYLFAMKCGLDEDVEAMTDGASCTLTTGPFVNRVFTPGVNDGTIAPVCFGSCTSCP